MARFVALVMFRLSTVPVLPFTYKPYSTVLQQGLTTLKAKVLATLGEELYSAQERSIGLLETAVDKFAEAADKFHKGFNSLRGKEDLGFGAAGGQERQMNDRLMLVERAFLSGPGLPKRPWFKHLIFAPEAENQYEGAMFPGVIDTLMMVGDQGQDLPAEQIAKEIGGPLRLAAEAVNNARKFLIHPLGATDEEAVPGTSD